jgi:hypothetical protein
MVGKIHRVAMIAAAALAPLALVTVVSPGVSNAAECGSGTVFDPPSTAAWRHRCHRLRHLRRPRGTVISRRTSRSASARPFRSCRCAPASKPGRTPGYRSGSHGQGVSPPGGQGRSSPVLSTTITYSVYGSDSLFCRYHSLISDSGTLCMRYERRHRRVWLREGLNLFGSQDGSSERPRCELELVHGA